MPAWATVVITLGGALIGALAALGGAWLHSKHTERERRAGEQRQRRERGAAVVAPLLALLSKIEPDLIDSLGDDGKQQFIEAAEQWRRMEVELLIFGAAHPRRGVMVSTDRVSALVGECFRITAAAVLARASMGNGDAEPLWADAQEHHVGTQEAVLSLLDEVREDDA